MASTGLYGSGFGHIWFHQDSATFFSRLKIPSDLRFLGGWEPRYVVIPLKNHHGGRSRAPPTISRMNQSIYWCNGFQNKLFQEILMSTGPSRSCNLTSYEFFFRVLWNLGFMRITQKQYWTQIWDPIHGR